MKDPEQIKHCALVLAALSAPERLRIVQYLRDGPRNVSEIADMLQIHAVNVSHHMTVLRHASLVESRKQGRFVFYSLSPGLLDPATGNEGVNLNLGCCRLEVPSDDKPGEA